MSSQLFVNPFPRGVDDTLHSLRYNGSLLLAGAAVTGGEPINWASIISGIGFNETNFLGRGNTLNTSSALVTVLAASAGTITATASNNFAVGQPVTFKGCTSTLGLLLNGQTFTVVTASATQFTFLSSSTGTGTGEVGFVYSGNVTRVLAKPSQKLNAPVTSLAVSGGIVTVTAANFYLPGAQVTFANLATALGLLLNGVNFTVLTSTGTAFTFATALTGSAGADTGTASGINPPQPYAVNFWSENGSGYLYQYVASSGSLFVLQSGAVTPAGTISAPTITTITNATPVVIGTNGGALTQVAGAAGITGVQAPTFTGAATTAAALSRLAAGAYPAGVLSDVIKYSALFARGA